MRVAVIGAGAAGLCALRHLLSRPKLFEYVVCFEMSNKVGGTWVYTDQTGTTEKGKPVFSSMYKNLITNLPKEVMLFPGYPFNQNLRSFINHTDVHRYLEDYAKEYNCIEAIKLNTEVVNVSPSEESRWILDYRDVNSDATEVSSEGFDAIFVCNGHYHSPLMPDIDGISEFKGGIMHSHDYRTPGRFTGKIVACLGAASSGQDIAIEACSVASKVYLCHNKPKMKTLFPANLEQKPGIRRLTASAMETNDGEIINIDEVVFCTGYRYIFPFLASKCHPRIQDERVYPLYKHIVHSAFRTLFLIGIPKTVCPFPMFHIQIQFCLASLDGSMTLPSESDMNADIDMDFKKRLVEENMPVRYAHFMATRQWPYNDQLADMAGIPRLNRSVQKLYDHVHEVRSVNITTYRQKNYKLDDSDIGYVEI